MGSLRDPSPYGNCKLSMRTSFLVLDSLLTKADCLIPPLCVYSAWYRIDFYICSGLIIEALYDLCALNSSPLVVERGIGV